VQFEDAVARLTSLPDILPPPPEALMPVRTDGVTDWRPRVSLNSLSVRPASVLVLLYPDDAGEARVVLTERVDRGGHHSGEVSFPGGSAEPADADVAATALREAEEEIALDTEAAGVTVIGQLEPFWIPVSNFRVTPILATAVVRPVLAANPAEVARIIEAPVGAFLPDGEIEFVERDVRGWPLRYGGYRIDGLHVWGATARILGQLGALLATSD
jgi:8-oxo-dGTP pyrophosphatase MutT (NUDIX family)